jgi:putative nucleotidyltransferase with HDIG domain
MHDLGSDDTRAALTRLRQALRDLGEEKERVTVTIASDLLSINDVRIIVDTQSTGPVLNLVDEMKRKRIEEIEFAPDVGVDELGSFLQLFFSEPSGEDVFGELTREISHAGIVNIRITEWIERVRYLRDAKIDAKDIRGESNRAMSRAVMFMGEVVRAIEQRRPVQLLKAGRITQQMSDIIQTDESMLIGLTSIKDYENYTFSHSVNVSVLSMLIADRMGLRKSDVARVGVAALFHDVGKTHIPREILDKPGALSDEEWLLMERHPMLGALELSRVRSLRAVADPLFVSLQHHLRFDGRGYPCKPGKWRMHPYVGMVAVADVYDAVTTMRTYRERTLRPDGALRYIARNSGGLFDPLVVKVFIRAMGIYPIGTVVELDTGERAVVIRQNERCGMMHRPLVALLRADGPPGEQIDLSQEAIDGSSRGRTIVGSVRDSRYEARKADCFVVT